MWIHQELTRAIIGAAIRVHRRLGPGLLESVYEACLSCEFEAAGIRHERQVSMAVVYRDLTLDCGYRLDLLGLHLNVTPFLEDQKREQIYGMEHIAIDTDELDVLVDKLKAQGIPTLEQTVVSGGRRVCFFEGPDGVQLEFIEMKK